jgi:hypothetical protein
LILDCHPCDGHKRRLHRIHPGQPRTGRMVRSWPTGGGMGMHATASKQREPALDAGILVLLSMPRPNLLIHRSDCTNAAEVVYRAYASGQRRPLHPPTAPTGRLPCTAAVPLTLFLHTRPAAASFHCVPPIPTI